MEEADALSVMPRHEASTASRPRAKVSISMMRLRPSAARWKRMPSLRDPGGLDVAIHEPAGEAGAAAAPAPTKPPRSSLAVRDPLHGQQHERRGRAGDRRPAARAAAATRPSEPGERRRHRRDERCRPDQRSRRSSQHHDGDEDDDAEGRRRPRRSAAGRSGGAAAPRQAPTLSQAMPRRRGRSRRRGRAARATGRAGRRASS